jgi:hypothetical protein
MAHLHAARQRVRERQTPTPRLDDSESIPRLRGNVATSRHKSLAARANIVRTGQRHFPLIRANSRESLAPAPEALAGFVLIPLWTHSQVSAATRWLVNDLVGAHTGAPERAAVDKLRDLPVNLKLLRRPASRARTPTPSARFESKPTGEQAPSLIVPPSDR